MNIIILTTILNAYNMKFIFEIDQISSLTLKILSKSLIIVLIFLEMKIN
jgi:hypothetical protein